MLYRRPIFFVYANAWDERFARIELVAMYRDPCLRISQHDSVHTNKGRGKSNREPWELTGFGLKRSDDSRGV